MKTAVEPEPFRPESFRTDTSREVDTGKSLPVSEPPGRALAASPDSTLHTLQRCLGNHATRRVLSGAVLQPKLTVGPPDDIYEKEADAVAEQVIAQTSHSAASGSDENNNDSRGEARNAVNRRAMQRSILRRIPIRTLQPTLGNRALARLLQQTLSSPATPMISRECACGGDAKSEEECAECREKKSALQRSSANADIAGLEAPPIVESVLASPGQPLATSARSTLESGFGHDFSSVRVHDDSRAAESAAAINARAYTVGNHIVFGDGQYTPGTSDGNRLLAHELTHTIQQTGGTPAEIQRLSWDDVTGAVSSLENTAEQGAEAAAAAVSSGAQAVGSAISSGAQAVGSAISSGIDSAEQAVASGAQSVAAGAQAAVSGAAAAVKGAASTVGSVISSAALAAASALAKRFGGTVKPSPSGTGIVISIPDVQIADVESETKVLPLGIPTQTLFDAGFKIGDFVINASAGTVIGDPSVTFALGPVRLQGIELLLDPTAGTYAGTAQLYVGSGVSGAAQKATELRLQAEGIIPLEVPIPIWGTAEVGIRDIFRLTAKEGVTEGITVGYSGGSFVFKSDLDVKLGALAQLDHEAFVRIEIESEEICSMIWPLKSHRYGDKAVEIHLPITVGSTSSGKTVKIGTPTAAPISVDSIKTGLEGDHEPSKCKSMKELTDFLCGKGKLPPSVCSILNPASPGGGGVGPIPIAPHGGGGVGPVPIGPHGGGGGPVPVTPVGPPGGGGTPPAASAPTGRTESDPIEMQWFKTDEHYDTPILLDRQKYHRKKPGQPLPPPDHEKEIGVEKEYLPNVGKIVILAFEPESGNKRRFIKLLADHGYDGFEGSGTDADHNQDLQWAGPDEFYNLWPMDFRTNRSAGESQNNAQKVVFSDRPGDPANPPMTLRDFKAAGLHQEHKYFVINRIFFS